MDYLNERTESAKCKPSKNYTGHVSVTVTGKTCQLWTSQTPHKHATRDGNFLWGETQSEARNYCRELDDEGSPWCYTTNPNTKWEPCHINLYGKMVFKTDFDLGIMYKINKIKTIFLYINGCNFSPLHIPVQIKPVSEWNSVYTVRQYQLRLCGSSVVE